MSHREGGAPVQVCYTCLSQALPGSSAARASVEFTPASGDRDEQQQRPACHVRERTAFHSRDQQQLLHHRGSAFQDNTGKQSYVSFYFTNVSVDISYFSLRQGFEVCGMMEDVYLAKKRNVNGGVFGFVRYGNVRDVEKLLKALNNVWFGDFRVVAKVASFDRFGNKRQAVGVEGAAVIRKDLVVHREENIRKVERGTHLAGDNFKEIGSVVGAAVNGRGNVVLEEAEGIFLMLLVLGKLMCPRTRSIKFIFQSIPRQSLMCFGRPKDWWCLC